VGRFKLTRNAETDVDGITDYTLRTWGERQCARYVDALESCFRDLAHTPSLGRACEHIRQGLMRQEQGKHVVFYLPKPYGVRIIRVLHERMLPDRHNIIDDE